MESFGLSRDLAPPGLAAKQEWQEACTAYDERRTEALLEAHLDEVLADKPHLTAIK